MSDKESKRLYYLVNKEWHKQKCRRRHLVWRAKAILRLGEVCAHCGFTDVRALQIDHILGGGAKEKEFYNGHIVEIYKKVVNTFGPLAYQLLCANCNTIKAFEDGAFRRGSETISVTTTLFN